MPSFVSRLSNITLIKKGGQKEVYRAKHPNLGLVAYKTGTYSGASSLERIKREVEFLRKTNSRGYPKNYDFEVDPITNTFYVLEEYIDGKTLSDSRHLYQSEPTIVGLLKRLVAELGLLWSNNIVHRDLKPDNIMIRNSNEVVIIDLGIARFLDLDSVTLTMGLRGPCTPIYAAPEQLTNNKRAIDKRSDFFVLGMISLELYLKHHPFDPVKVGNTNNIVENILMGKYIAPVQSSTCSKPFCELISSMLAVQPYKRFRDHRDLERFLNTNWR
jgi:serine/threonine-protein kinase